MAAVDSTSSQPKIVSKVFNLPIVSDTCAYGLATASSLTSLLQPYLSSSLASLTPMVQTQLCHILALGEERLPEVVTSRVRVARNQVTAGVQYLDSTLCSGLDRLVVKVPSLQSPSPALYSSTREAAVSQLTQATTFLATTTTQATTFLATTTTQATTFLATTTTQATTYLASFTLAQLALKVSDAGLETASSLLKQLVPASCTSQCEPLVAGIKKVRGQVQVQVQVEVARREGARASCSMKVANMESSSSFSAVCEVFGLNYILAILGISRVIAEAESAVVMEDVSGESGAPAEVVEEDISGKTEAPAEVVEQEVVAEKAIEQILQEQEQVHTEVLVDLKEGKKSKKAYKN